MKAINANQCISWTDTSGVGYVDKYPIPIVRDSLSNKIGYPRIPPRREERGDGVGNLITETNTATSVNTDYFYDYENHQTVYSTTGTTAVYKTDAMGRRTSKTVNGSVVAYTHDGANVYADMNGFSGTLRYKYITPFLDQNLMVLTGTTKYYYVHDGLGSVRNLLDSTQAIKNTYDYWAFGGMRLDSEQVPQRYKFTGREYDSESSSFYYRDRQYRPNMGRFNSRDKADYHINLYSYVLNNPVNYTDPTGRVQVSVETIDSTAFDDPEFAKEIKEQTGVDASKAIGLTRPVFNWDSGYMLSLISPGSWDGEKGHDFIIEGEYFPALEFTITIKMFVPLTNRSHFVQGSGAGSYKWGNTPGGWSKSEMAEILLHEKGHAEAQKALVNKYFAPLEEKLRGYKPRGINPNRDIAAQTCIDKLDSFFDTNFAATKSSYNSACSIANKLWHERVGETMGMSAKNLSKALAEYKKDVGRLVRDEPIPPKYKLGIVIPPRGISPTPPVP